MTDEVAPIAEAFQFNEIAKKAHDHLARDPVFRQLQRKFRLIREMACFQSTVSLVEAVDQAGEHLGDDFEPLFESKSCWACDQRAPPRDLQERHTFLGRAAPDREEVAAIGFREAAVSLGKVCGDREGGAIQLIDEESVTAWETLGHGSDLVCEVDGLLIDVDLLEHEGHDGLDFENGRQEFGRWCNVRN